MRKRQISTKRTAAQALCHHSFCSLLKLSERAALFLTGAMAVEDFTITQNFAAVQKLLQNSAPIR
jgi:hypothetical protein